MPAVVIFPTSGQPRFVGFFKGKQFAKDEKQTTGDEWLMGQWEVASGIERPLTLSQPAEGAWALYRFTERSCLPAEASAGEEEPQSHPALFENLIGGRLSSLSSPLLCSPSPKPP